MREQSVFIEVLEREDPAERALFLDRECAGDPALRQRIERLLKRHQQADSLMDAPAIKCNPTDAICTVIESPGSQIGPCKLLEQIGEGGMGVVFMAEQTRPVQRRVALKIIKAGMDTREVVARFEAERQALAMMDHPNIARVLDAGATDTGRPYFVMELVRGVPMTEFCNQKSLSIRERLELFVTVCQAVQHAHQKGIIHRDIKPTNVLITLHDGRPMIKVIDFGVAKATGQKLTDKTLFTGFSQMIGTPLYMSPEQAEMTSQDIDTRSDIFSAGVLLYELLTGTTPFDSQRLKNVAFDELRRIIREEEPPRPSARLTTIAAEAASTVSKERKSDPRQLSRLFRGELDWIVMKCLEKDRTRRYETASALASDVERYLHDEPVQACPPSARYRFSKFARRNKGTLLTAAAVMVALVLGTVVSAWQAVRAFDAEAQAKTSEAKATTGEQQATAALEFLTSILRSPDPNRDGRSITVAEVLDHSVKELQGKFADNPLTKAKLLSAVGQSYQSLGLYREAVPLFEQARHLYDGALGSTHSDTLTSMNTLAQAYLDAGRMNQAISLFEETVTLGKANLGQDHPCTLNSMGYLAGAYGKIGQFDKSVSLSEEVLKLCKAKWGPEHCSTLGSMNNLAITYRAAGRIDEALRLDEETLKLRKAKLGPEHPDILKSMSNLAMAAGRIDEAIRLKEQTLRLTKSKLGLDNPQTLESMLDLGCAYFAAGRIEKAIQLNEGTLKLMKVKLGPEHQNTINVQYNLATCYRVAGRLDEAIRLDEELSSREKAKYGPEYAGTLGVANTLALDYRAAGRFDEAIRLGEETLKHRKAILGPVHPSTLLSLQSLADTYVGANRLAEAESPARECWEIFEKTSRDDTKSALDLQDLAAMFDRLGQAYVTHGDVAAALNANQRGLEISQKLASDKPSDAEAQRDLDTMYQRLGDVHLLMGNFSAARDAYYKSFEIAQKLGRADDLGVAYCKRGSMDVGFGNYRAARENYQKSLEIHQKQAQQDPAAWRERRVASSYELLGIVSLQSGNLSDAYADFQKELEIFWKLAGDDPKDASRQRDLACAYSDLGHTKLLSGDVAAARDNYQKCLEIRSKLAQRDPRNVEAQTDLADSFESLGHLETSDEKFPAAVHWYEQGIAILEKLNKDGATAGQPGYQASLHEQKQAMAVCRSAPQAIDSLEFALGQPKEIVPELLGLRARALALHGKSQEAAATADKLESLDLADNRDLFHAAAGFALCADGMGAAQRRVKPTPDTKALEERYAVRAVELLKKAQAKGYFKDPVHLAALTGNPFPFGNPNLDLLHPREDFQKLLADNDPNTRPLIADPKQRGK